MKPIKKATNLKEQTIENDLFDKKAGKKHAQDLGLEIPDDYFSKSKSKIIALTEEQKKPKLIKLRKSFIWMAAAGFALIFALTVYKFNTAPKTDRIITKASDTIEQIQNFYLNNDNFYMEEDVLLTSLYVNENEIDAYVDNDLFNEIIVDEYIDDYIIENTMDEKLFFN